MLCSFSQLKCVAELQIRCFFFYFSCNMSSTWFIRTMKCSISVASVSRIPTIHFWIYRSNPKPHANLVMHIFIFWTNPNTISQAHFHQATGRRLSDELYFSPKLQFMHLSLSLPVGILQILFYPLAYITNTRTIFFVNGEPGSIACLKIYKRMIKDEQST